MAIKENIIDDVIILSASGKLMGGNETWEIHDKVKHLISYDFKKIVIDLSNIKWINSQGLGVLMTCVTSLKNADGAMAIAGAAERVSSLFMITRLSTVFDTYESVDEAIAALK
ncbi:STAS domain-containing protein [candidate division KSB1 bacterium]|nr:STAS domain-containing protein [candidate division KSB1 bacterium]